MYTKSTEAIYSMCEYVCPTISIEWALCVLFTNSYGYRKEQTKRTKY